MGFASKVQELLNEAEDPHALVNMTDDGGHTVMHWAAKRGDMDIFEMLADHRAPLFTPSQDAVGMQPMHWACTEGHMEVRSTMCPSYHRPVGRHCVGHDPHTPSSLLPPGDSIPRGEGWQQHRELCRLFEVHPAAHRGAVRSGGCRRISDQDQCGHHHSGQKQGLGHALGGVQRCVSDVLVRPLGLEQMVDKGWMSW